MGISPVWAAMILCVICPVLGALPAIAWMVQGFSGKQLSALGTGNISVSAAFYHGGTKLGLLAVLSEALKGIGAVLLARFLFPDWPLWEVIALIALVLGRYGATRGAGTTNVVWGYVVHDWRISLSILILGGLFFAIGRRRQVARLIVLALIPLLEALYHPDQPGTVAAATGLSLLIAAIYTQIPDDLALAADQPNASTRKIFHFLRGQDVISSLDDRPQVQVMGQKAATLAQLKQWGYPVPPGWILPTASRGQSLLQRLTATDPNPWSRPWIVRSSAIAEDQSGASAAGQYQSIANITNPTELEQAIRQCRESYRGAGATQYRRDRGLGDQVGMALLVQQQIQGVYSGVAFSRDPIDQGEEVVVEALAGGAEKVVSGQVTPAQFRIAVDEAALTATSPADLSPIQVDDTPTQAIPPALVQRVADLARHLELRYHGIPQDIEWTFDGHYLWLLQARPITTLTPIWTRKIAAEVIPGVIRPLTWSINRPLTCGVWGQIFAIVLGPRSQGLDFTATATLHYSRAYFNATLLGQIFRRMGLPPESLEFLTLGAKFSKPPLLSTLKNVPGLLRLLQREWNLIQAFQRDQTHHFAPTLAQLAQHPPTQLTAPDLLNRVALILAQLEKATYYSILAPLSFSLRRTLLKVPDTALDQRQLPEVASLQAVKALAAAARQQVPAVVKQFGESPESPTTATLLAALSADPQGQTLLAELDQVVDRYGYLSEVGTDIAVPTWREDPQPVQDLFAQFFLHPPQAAAPTGTTPATGQSGGWRQRQVQQRLNLKGQVAQVYLTLLAELRWSLVALEALAVQQGLLPQVGDGFFLTYDELQRWLAVPEQAPEQDLQALVAQRRSQFAQHQALPSVPFIVYGHNPPPDPTAIAAPPRNAQPGVWQGIGASVGQVEGPVKVLTTLQVSTPIPPNTILVVPYTDAGWAPLLARAAGLIAEVGGRLSHGAIVAREYNIPAVMNIAHATQQFRDGQTVRLDGRAGTVELVE